LDSVSVTEISPSDRVRTLELQTIAKHCFFLQVVKNMKTGMSPWNKQILKCFNRFLGGKIFKCFRRFAIKSVIQNFQQIPWKKQARALSLILALISSLLEAAGRRVVDVVVVVD